MKFVKNFFRICKFYGILNIYNIRIIYLCVKVVMQHNVVDDEDDDDDDDDNDDDINNNNM